MKERENLLTDWSQQKLRTIRVDYSSQSDTLHSFNDVVLLSSWFFLFLSLCMYILLYLANLSVFACKNLYPS